MIDNPDAWWPDMKFLPIVVLHIVSIIQFYDAHQRFKISMEMECRRYKFSIHDYEIPIIIIIIDDTEIVISFAD